MNAGYLGASAETRFNDLQADIEAGSRLINRIHQRAASIRDTLKGSSKRLAEDLEAVLTQLGELKACVLLQRSLMRELRRDVRTMRALLEKRPLVGRKMTRDAGRR